MKIKMNVFAQGFISKQNGRKIGNILNIFYLGGGGGGGGGGRNADYFIYVKSIKTIMAKLCDSS